MAIEAAILGATGFGGGELLRLLAQHPRVGGLQAVSRSQVGQPVHGVHPHLRGVVELQFSAAADFQRLAASEAPVLFAAMPHGAFAEAWPTLEQAINEAGLSDRLRVIDLSADFRLASGDDYPRWYGRPHPCPQALPGFVYGLSEWRREQIAGALRIANPGCFATALELGLLPLAALGVDSVMASAITGSSGSGASASAGTHHPTRSQDFRAYKILDHQHEGEVRRVLAEQGWQGDFSFVPHSAPLVRGIFATLQFRLPAGVDLATLEAAFDAAYARAPFVRRVSGSPRVAAVAGSNFAEIGLAARAGHGAVMVAIDNLVKGMAGQAIQNMNLSLGLDEALGLKQAALYP